MTALSKIRKAGFTLSISNNALSVIPASRLTTKHREFIKQHKAEIIDELKAESDQRFFEFLITRQDGSQFYSATIPFSTMAEMKILFRDARAIEPVTGGNDES
jgi:hypothetical protein